MTSMRAAGTGKLTKTGSAPKLKTASRGTAQSPTDEHTNYPISE